MKSSTPKSSVVRWSPRLEKLRALSLKQPWAWLVVNGYKDIENRRWRTTHRGPLLIHASRSNPDYTPDQIEKKYGVRIPDEVETGGIVGVVDVVNCVERHPSKWKFPAQKGWVLKDARRLPFRACRGFVGIFKPHFPR
jgi:ASCH domain